VQESSTGSTMRFCSLASSSRAGNAYVIQSAETTILVDFGVRLRRMEQSLDSVGVNPSEIDAVLITHEHGDHCRGLHIKHPLHARYGIDALYSSRGTWRQLGAPDAAPYRTVGPSCPVLIGGIRVRALPTSHDAAEPQGFMFCSGEEQLGLVTDLGTVEPHIITALRGAHHLVFESNHDVRMEEESGRPLHLIQRVMGRAGHLSNEQAGAALAEIAGHDTRTVLLAHLSTECNTPERASATCSTYLERAGRSCPVQVAPSAEPSPWFGEGVGEAGTS